jgi:hypothetical protein
VSNAYHIDFSSIERTANESIATVDYVLRQVSGGIRMGSLFYVAFAMVGLVGVLCVAVLGFFSISMNSEHSKLPQWLRIVACSTAIVILSLVIIANTVLLVVVNNSCTESQSSPSALLQTLERVTDSPPCVAESIDYYTECTPYRNCKDPLGSPRVLLQMALLSKEISGAPPKQIAVWSNALETLVQLGDCRVSREAYERMGRHICIETNSISRYTLTIVAIAAAIVVLLNKLLHIIGLAKYDRDESTAELIERV